MTATTTPGADNLTAGSWALWAIGMASVAARLVSRYLALGGWRKYQLDDYLMMVCAVTFTGIVVCSNQVKQNDSNYASDEVIASMNAQQIRNAIWGSKMLIVLEQFSLATLWLVKACLLLLYARLTSGLAEGYAVKAVGLYCAIGYVVIQILYFGVWCRPFHMYWSLPVPIEHEQCRTYLHHMITVTVFHVSSDLLMLLIPVPMIARARLPLVRKVILVIIFSLGLLVVLVAILNRYYNFTITNSYVFLIWYNGEASTAVMVANIPFCWTLLRHIFSLGAWTNSSRRNASGAQRLDDNDPRSSAAKGGDGAGPRSQLSQLRHQQHALKQHALNQKALAAGQTFFSETTTTSSSGNNSRLNSGTKISSTKYSSIVVDPFKSESMERMTEEEEMEVEAGGGTSLRRLDSKPDSIKNGDIEMRPPTKLHLHYQQHIGGVKPVSNERDIELGL